MSLSLSALTVPPSFLIVLRKDPERILRCGWRENRGTLASFWKEEGGESSMSQSTAARIPCVLHARGEVEGVRGTIRAI